MYNADKEIEKSIEKKLQRLCKIMGKLDIIEVNHTPRNLKERNIITDKVVLNEIKDKIVLTVDNKVWILEKIKLDFKNSVMYQVASESYKMERIFTDMYRSSVYSINSRFYDIHNDGKLLSITENNVNTLYDYFSISIIKYALEYNLNIPYINFENNEIIANRQLTKYINKVNNKSTIKMGDKVTVIDIFRDLFTNKERDIAIISILRI